MWIIDRYILRQFVHVFFTCWCSLTGLYVVFDAFNYLDEFMRFSEKNGNLLAIMGSFYAYRSILFFDRISAVLAITSAMFTVAWIQRHNELTALMAAGISRRRVVLPVIFASALIGLVAAASRELVIPHLADELSREANDLAGEGGRDLRPRYDHQNEFLFRGQKAFLNEHRIARPNFILRPALDPQCRQIVAECCYYHPADGQHPAGYLFTSLIAPRELLDEPSLVLDGRPVIITPKSAPEWIGPNDLFVASDVDFDQLVGGTRYRQFSSIGQLIAGLSNAALDFGADVRVAIHARIVQPVLDVTLLFLGLPIVLRRDRGNMFVAIGLCGGVIMGFLVVTTACQYLGAAYLVQPALAAWLPLMLFVPMAVALYDRVDG
ncbi:MAG TPA: LptF/LptG family permease [Pirellulales bacterium]|jgi:lipopolysaccharide export system permease protein|nr:LptF/LptG family permease [Pirellulales bacterium]